MRRARLLLRAAATFPYRAAGRVVLAALKHAAAVGRETYKLARLEREAEREILRARGK